MTQKEMVLAHLKRVGNITPIEALDKYCCFRLASVISKLKDDGENIISSRCNRGNKWYAKYLYFGER